jgi:phage N-6-adenine-methyltransferase
MNNDEQRENTENKSNTPVNIRDLWQTPKEIFNKLNSEFNFICDVAADNNNCLCSQFIGEEQDSLGKHRWLSSNWCNPPYSNITPWVNKAIDQHSQGKTIVMLVPADTSVKWFKLAYESCNEVRFISGRISFINAETQKPVSGNNKGSVLFIWKAHAHKNSHTVTLIDRDYFYQG